MTAPSCPVSFGQQPSNRQLLRNGQHGLPPNFPVIPLATDLPSLIRTVNVIRDVLRQLTTSLTVNNYYAQRPTPFRAQGNTYYSEYPEWQQVDTSTAPGYVFHKDKDKTVDQNQKAYVIRMNSVTFQNLMQEDPEFVWRYYKPTDA